MFRKVRIKLTLINVIVTGLLLLLFVAGTYLVMQAEIFNQSQQLMQMIAKDAGSNLADRPHARRLAQYFSVKVDTSGNIVQQSSDLPLAPGQLSTLVQEALRRNRPRGEIEWQDNDYSYLKAPLDTGQGSILVFVNIEREKNIQGFLLIALAVGGLISLLLAFYGSLFMADKAMVPIKKWWQRQKDFVADASHELRTPLAVIQTNLELVMGNPEDSVESQGIWLENIQAETQRMAKLVDGLLFLARADSEQHMLEVKSFPLSQALAEAVKPFEPLAASRGIRLLTNLEAEIMFKGDENRLKQLAIILLDNALKHTPSGGEVQLALAEHGNEVVFRVSDTGEGIEAKHLERIFERFYRVDKARSSQQGGTGLGLAIADWIVKSHQGTIEVSSVPGQGTIFTVHLPKTTKSLH